MITVTQFEVSSDRTQIDVSITVTAPFFVADLQFWDQSTYKVADDAIDLSSKIVGTGQTETFTITTTDAGVGSFDGLYFLQIETTDATEAPGIVGTMSLLRYYNANASLLANVDLSCLNCNENFQNALLLDLYVTGMQNALMLGRFRDAIDFLTSINIIESFECDECDEINPVVSTANNLISIGVIDCILDI